MIDLIELIALQLRQVKLVSYSNVIRFDFGELFGLGYPPACLYFGDDNILFLAGCRGGSLSLRSDVDHKLVIVGVEVIECCLGLY